MEREPPLPLLGTLRKFGVSFTSDAAQAENTSENSNVCVAIEAMHQGPLSRTLVDKPGAKGTEPELTRDGHITASLSATMSAMTGRRQN